MHVKTASSETNSKLQIVLSEDALTLPPRTTKTITAFVDYLLDLITTSTKTSLEKFTETASLLISHSLSTLFDEKAPVRVTNTTESSYSVKKSTQTVKFSVVTLEQPKYIKPLDMVILNMIPEGDPDLTAYLTELLRTNNPGRLNNTWFPAPEYPDKPEDHTPMQT